MNEHSRRPQVAFVVRHINHYREDFYGRLIIAMSERGIDLEIVHGRPTPRDATKQDEGTVSGSTLVENRVIYLRGQELVYQPVFRRLVHHDLVIVEQASRLILNYLLIVRRLFGRSPAVALIGHGENVAKNSSGIGERVKRAVTARADWFFGYTEGTRHRLIEQGYPPDQITVFQNTIDTSGLRSAIAAVSPSRREAVRQGLEVGAHDPLLIVLGSLYADKRPMDAVDAVSELRSSGINASLLFVGSGELAPAIDAVAAEHTWVRHVGAAHGQMKAELLAASDAMIIPGVSGLVVLDAFAAGLPLVTIDNPHHPPEIAYVEHERNGVILPAGSTASDLASAIRHLVADDERNRIIAAGAKATGELLTLESMVEKFADGLSLALDHSAP